MAQAFYRLLFYAIFLPLIELNLFFISSVGVGFFRYNHLSKEKSYFVFIYVSTTIIYNFTRIEKKTARIELLHFIRAFLYSGRKKGVYRYGRSKDRKRIRAESLH